MKILSVTSYLLGNDAASWRICNIARLLQEKGNDVKLIQYAGKSARNTQIAYNKDLDGIRSSIIAGSHLTVPMKHLKELSREKYDLVYGNTHFGTFCAIAGVLKRVPLIFDMHGGLIEEFGLKNQGKPYWRFMPDQAFEYLLEKTIDVIDRHKSNKIICVSRWMIKYLNQE
jgi:hypothetical protein